jgi:predicted nucleotidyltransferase component of viral defense system
MRGAVKIPREHIVSWRLRAPWRLDQQVEQDLVIGRALVEMFTTAEVAGGMALRGGAALYKLQLPALRYSGDIDLAQVRSEPIGATLDALHSALDGWLGAPKRLLRPGRIILVYRFGEAKRLKVKINSIEHLAVLGYERRRFEVASGWFSGRAEVLTFRIEELLGTKMRALYQRKRGRDLFDLGCALGKGVADPDRIVKAFLRHLEHEKRQVGRRAFEDNLARKMTDRAFLDDVKPLLASGAAWDADAAHELVRRELIARLPGGSGQSVE